ncbi:MAG: ribonuclease Z [Clostridium sp.]
MLDICLLGCGGGMPMPFRGLSATLLSYKGRKILIDCGEGTQVSMRIVGWGFKTIDVICITHCHGDHIVGLPGLLSTIGNSGRDTPLTIIGPEGITEIVNGLRVIAKYLPYEIKIIENPSVVELSLNKDGLYVSNEKKGQVILKTIELEHSSPCIGYSMYFNRDRKFNVEKAMKNHVPKVIWSKLQKEERVIHEGKEYNGYMVLGDERKGIKVSLVTDSRPLDTIPSFIEDSDLFICEGTYGKDEDMDKAIKNKHMTYREAATLAKDGQVNELLLTHFSPAMLDANEFVHNAKSVFSNTIIGEDRLVKSLSFID